MKTFYFTTVTAIVISEMFSNPKSKIQNPKWERDCRKGKIDPGDGR
jgi:hypothetical protein